MRTKRSLINLTTVCIGQMLVLFFQLLNRFVFVRTLSAEYLGVSGLFTNILSILSLAELGVGSAMTFSLYVPLVQQDTERIKSLMRLYRNTYRVIGCVVLSAGLAMLPVYPFFISGKPDIDNLNVIYVLYVLNSSVTYFYSYKRSLIIADQRKYIESLVYYSRHAVMNVLQVIILFLTHNFIIYLVCQFVCQFLENFIISKIADKMYPYIKNKEINPIEHDDIQMIKRNVGALVFHKIGGMVVSGTSSILISKFISLAVAGVYSNYILITNALNSIVSQAFTAITGSVGNLEASEQPSKILSVFYKIYYFNFFIIGFCTICLLCLFQPFISLWVGSGYLLDNLTMVLFVINFYVNGMRRAVLTFRDASASYYYDRYKPLIEAILNLTLSIILIKLYGLVGLLFATTISTLFTSTWIEPFVLYRHVFFEKFRDFIKRFVLYALIIVFNAFVAVNLFNLVTSQLMMVMDNELLFFIVQLTIAVIISAILMTITTCWTKEFKELFQMCADFAYKLRK